MHLYHEIIYNFIILKKEFGSTPLHENKIQSRSISPNLNPPSRDLPSVLFIVVMGNTLRSESDEELQVDHPAI